MTSKRLNIMLYSPNGGEQIILPVNPKDIQIKYEKTVEKFDILGFGEVNVMGNRAPLRITLSHFLPEDDSVFGTSSRILYEASSEASKFIEFEYSSKRVVEILKKWAFEKTKIRFVLDQELNMYSIVTSFRETIRESTSIKPYELEILEYRNPEIKSIGELGLIKRQNTQKTPKTILMKKGETVYSIADKYGLDFNTLAKNNNIKDVNAEMTGKKLFV